MKVNRILLILLILFLLVPGISFVGWLTKEKSEFDVLVIDKTVPKREDGEHKSIFWLLNHNRIVKNDHKAYNKKKDYFGFFPVKTNTTKEYYVKSIRLTALDSLVENNDMLFIADAYGVFYADWYSGLGDIENSTLIYGGFNQNDYYLLQRFKEANKLIIAEYNLFGHPTNPLIRYKTQDLLGVKYTGWSGKYFSSLAEEADEVPHWIIKRYKRKYNKSWPYKNAGIVLLTREQVIVLEEGIHLDSALPQLITTSNFASKYNLPQEIPFTGWFEVIENNDVNIEMAQFVIHTNSFGDEFLNKAGLESSFPAIVGNTLDYKYMYIAADFSRNKIPYSTYRFQGIERIQDIFYSSDIDDTKRFFWEYYTPMMLGVIEEYRGM
jgi:voltage-gated potassium channel Kch